MLTPAEQTALATLTTQAATAPDFKKAKLFQNVQDQLAGAIARAELDGVPYSDAFLHAIADLVRPAPPAPPVPVPAAITITPEQVQAAQFVVARISAKNFNKGVKYAREFQGTYDAANKLWTIPTHRSGIYNTALNAPGLYGLVVVEVK